MHQGVVPVGWAPAAQGRVGSDPVASAWLVDEKLRSEDMKLIAQLERMQERHFNEIRVLDEVNI